jgi:lipoprotein NlpD
MPVRAGFYVSSSVNCAISVARVFLLCATAAVLAGCTAHRAAPVVDRAPGAKSAPARPASAAKPVPRPADVRPDTHVVRKGDTLYSVALDHGLDYRELAQWNGIADAGVIREGQQLRLRPPPSAATVAPLRTAPGVQARPLGESAPAGDLKTQPMAVRAPYSDQAYAQLAGIRPAPPAGSDARPPAGPGNGDEGLDWAWPASGKIVSTYSDSGNLKGIGIAGKLGQPVLASAPGRVIFSGTGIRGFGKLIVIKHNNTFLSVYAHNSELLVKEGQAVTRGQRIAEMGSTDTDRVKLHFEIRRFGKPVDPVKLLPPA